MSSIANLAGAFFPFFQPKRHSSRFTVFDPKTNLNANCREIRVYAIALDCLPIYIGHFQTKHQGDLDIDYHWCSEIPHQLKIQFCDFLGPDDRGSCCGLYSYRILDTFYVEGKEKTEERQRIPFNQPPFSLDPLRDAKIQVHFQPSLGYAYDLFIRSIGPMVIPNYYAKFSAKTLEDLDYIFGSPKQRWQINTKTSIDLALNGMSTLCPTPVDKGRWALEMNWDAEDLKSGENDPVLPNVKMVVFENKGELDCEYLEIKFPYDKTPERFTIEDGEKLIIPLLLFNYSISVGGVLKSHLARSHLFLEQLVRAVKMSITDHPILELLAPFMGSIQNIDYFGSDKVFGKEGLTKITAIRQEAILSVLEKELGSLCWTDQPRNCLSDKNGKPLKEDRASAIYKLVYDAIEKYVDRFFNLKISDKVNKEKWSQIYLLSRHLVEGSCSVPNHLAQERDGREVVNGKLKAFRPITSSPRFDQPQDVTLLKWFSVKLIATATIDHSYVHQAEDRLEDLSYAPLSLKKVEDRYVMSVDDGRQQRLVVKVLGGVQRGQLVENSYSDLDPQFVKEILTLEKPLQELGYDVKELWERNNI